MSAVAHSPTTAEHVERLRARRASRLDPRDRIVGYVLGGGFVAGALALAALTSTTRSPSPAVVALLIVSYAVLTRVKFEVSAGYAVPTQLALVPMLFVLPLGQVPLAVGSALMLAAVVDAIRGRIHLERALIHLINGWHALGAAAVLLAFGEGPPALDLWPVYAAALLAQFAADFACSAIRGAALGVSPLPQLRAMSESYGVDCALAPLGVVVAVVAVDSPLAVAGVLPLVGLFGYFARERRTRIDHALELSQAYKGTAFLLGDVVEADDAYTGSHSRHVVDLVMAVANELGLDQRARRDAEFVALLHDVGKIRVPAAIVNKPGPLDDAEWAVMKQHTIDGERMLSGVGGLLAEVGTLVRSCHERWDGGGYPDGLTGEETPLIARIVMACDAYSAMTTDRAYRRAMAKPDALAELLTHSGTQFDPRVVEALVRLETR